MSSSTSRPTGDEPYFRPEVHRFERPNAYDWATPSGRDNANQKLARNKNPYAVQGLETEAQIENRGNSMGIFGGGGGGAAGVAFKTAQGIQNLGGGTPFTPFSNPIPGTQYTSAEGIPQLRHDASVPKFSGKNVAKFAGRAGINAGLTAALDYGVDAATKESRQSKGEIIAEILKRKYGHKVDPITALTFYDQYMQDEGDMFDRPEITSLGIQHNTAATLMGEGLGMANPVAGSAMNAARNYMEKPGRMAQYEMLADRMNSEYTAGDIRSAAMRQYAGQYGVEGVKKRFPTLGWEDWKPKSGKE